MKQLVKAYICYIDGNCSSSLLCGVSGKTIIEQTAIAISIKQISLLQ